MPSAAIPRDQRLDVGPGLTDAGEVGHGDERRRVLHVEHGVERALAGRATGAVGDRAERRLERLELSDGLLELPQHLVGARRHELERERRSVGQQVGDLCHAVSRSAHSMALRKSMAIVVGPTPPTRGVIAPATSSHDSSTSGRSVLP